MREERIAPDGYAVHENGASERAAEGELVLDGWRAEAPGALLEQEAAYFVIPLAARPDDEEVAAGRNV